MKQGFSRIFSNGHLDFASKEGTLMLFLRDDDLVALVLQLMAVNHWLKHQFPI